MPPSSAIPAVVLATDPPETKRGAPMDSCTALAVARSMRVIDPFSRPTWASCSSVASSMTSSSGDPMATTSRSWPAPSPASGGEAAGSVDGFVGRHGARNYPQSRG